MADPDVRILAHTEAVPRIRTELTRRGFLAVGGGGALAALLAACSPGGSAPSGAPAGSGGAAAISGTVNMFTWAEYNAPEVLETFQNEKGATISLTEFASNEEMLGKLEAARGQSGFDLLVPTGGFIPYLRDNGHIQQLDKSKIPNLANLQSEFTSMAWDPTDEWSVCKNWGTTGFVYDNTVITRELKTWADFIDAAQNEASGRTSILDDPIELTGIYFWANGIDWNTTNTADYDAAEAWAVSELAPHIAAFDSHPGGGAIPLATFALIQAWNGDARMGILESEDPERWTWVLGAPMTELWMDTYVIAANAPNPDAAHAFIDYILDPEVSLLELDWNGYHTGVADIQGTAEDAGLELLDLVFFSEQQLTTMTEGTLDMQERRVEIWNKVKAAAGQA